MNSEMQTKLTADEIAEALNFAKQAMLEAGDIALRYFRQPIDIENKLGEEGYDPVTCADREVEASLRNKLGKRFPGFGVVG